MELVFLIALGIFIASSIGFLILRRGKAFNTAFFVSFVTIASYLVMYEGGLVGESASGEQVFWTRWIFYGVSCSLLVYEIAGMLGKTNKEKLNLLYLTVIVMITGALASFYVAEFKWAFFAISSVAYGFMLWSIFKTKSKFSGTIAQYILLGWTVFPIVFFFSPEGLDMITAVQAGIAYLVLDVFTKIVFYLDPRLEIED